MEGIEESGADTRRKSERRQGQQQCPPCSTIASLISHELKSCASREVLFYRAPRARPVQAIVETAKNRWRESVAVNWRRRCGVVLPFERTIIFRILNSHAQLPRAFVHVGSRSNPVVIVFRLLHAVLVLSRPKKLKIFRIYTCSSQCIMRVLMYSASDGSYR